MADIESATAEIRRGKKERRKKKIEEETTGQNIMSASATQGGYKQEHCNCRFVFRSVRAYIAVVSDGLWQHVLFLSPVLE